MPAVLRRLRIENLVLIREADIAFAPGLNAITGETGAGKTILAQAIGLLLGASGDERLVGPAGDDAYVEAELDAPSWLFEDEELEALAELRPEGEEGLVVARRVFADGRTRAYAWGRSAAKDDVAAAVERLIAMSGQFEQRRLARPSYQLAVLDAYSGPEQQRRRNDARRAWRVLQAARREAEELARDAGRAAERIADLRALADDTDGLTLAAEEALLAERERLRHLSELVAGTAAAGEALSPDEGSGAVALVAAAARALAGVERLAPELAAAAEELRDAEARLADVATDLRAYLTELDAEPGRLDELEAELERYDRARRRHRATGTADLLERAAAARAELERVDTAGDPAAAAQAALAAAEAELAAIAAALRQARTAAAPAFAAAVSEELRGVGLGDGELQAALGEGAPGPTGADDVRFLIRPNAGLPFAPAADTASGGELSRVALAIAAVAGGETMVFDEIDAGIGGQTANRVADTLARLAGRAQVITITHLPQIASRADRHFRVEKIAGDPTHTRIDALSEADRRDELERMLGGREFLSSLDR
jgi:DNA repair protein RecN (Recombination protein N)